MVSREHKIRDSLHDKLQVLRSVTNSHAVNDTSIILDASNYIKDLKEKVERLNKDSAGSSNNQKPWPKVSVETLEKGFIVNVYSTKSCSGLLVSLLEAFEELHLNVLEARVSCKDSFHLQAYGGGENEEEEENCMNAQVVKEAISDAIKNWHETNNEQD